MASNLVDILRQIRPTGPEGFEGLIAALLESLTGVHFTLASGGFQAGRDMSSRPLDGNVTAIECKRYGSDTELDERELLGELFRVDLAIPDLDLWILVTSREVDSTLYETLTAAADQIGIEFFSVSSGDGKPSSLEVLCAYSPSIVVSYPSIKRIAKTNEILTELNKVASHPNFNISVSTLKQKFASPRVGYDNWRTRQNELFLNSLKSDREARAAYGQPINLYEPRVMLIERQELWTSLDKWRTDWPNRYALTTLGEEGDGKTWGVMAWLASQIKSGNSFPGVIFLASSDLSESELTASDLHTLFARMISRAVPTTNGQKMLRRFSRWISRLTEHPLFLIVLDGINERHSANLWRGLLEKLAGESYSSHVRVLITCRTNFWQRHFQRLRYLGTTVFTLEPYNDDELNTALRFHNLDRADIDDTVLSLIRKPRYFDLMTKHHKRLAESGEVTVARLIYEDWRDRYERKRSMILTDDDFQKIIRDLALAHVTTGMELSGTEVTDALSLLSDRDEILKELHTSGILRRHKNRFTVDERQLAFGLGLLLVDQLERAVIAEEDPRETIAAWLEPKSDMDIKAAICEFAVLEALGSALVPLAYKEALLEAWVLNHNPTETTESNLTAYLPVCPQAYVALAESVWSEDLDNRWVQEALTRAFVSSYAFQRVSTVLLPTFERWLGFVLIHGSPYLRNDKDELEKRKNEISERLGGKVEPGSLELAGYPLTIIEDDGLIRLGRVALAVISHLPRKEFVRCFVLGCLADVIAGGSGKYDVIAWCIRSSRQSLWSEIHHQVTILLATASEVTQRAASRLLAFEGSSEAYNLQQTIPKKIVSSRLLERHEIDPCTSGFAWSAENYASCLQRQDLPPAWVARHLGDYAADPKLTISDYVESQLRTLGGQVDVNDMWVVLGTTSADHTYETYEPTLAAFTPDTGATLIRSVTGQITDRREMKRRQLSLKLEEHYLVLDRGQQELLKEAWENLIALPDTWTEAERVSEMVLFQIILTQMSGDDQFATLLRRPAKAANLVSYKDSFRPVSNWQSVRIALTSLTNDLDLYRSLWFLSGHPNNIPADLFDQCILPLFDHKDEFVRSKVLRIIYETGNAKGIETAIETWGYNVSFEGYQNHWGSLIVAKYGATLNFDQLVQRVHPGYLGYAVQIRGSRSLEVLSYAELLNQLLVRIANENAEISNDLPTFKIELSARSNIQDTSRLTLPAELFNRSITFVDPYSDRGGLTRGGEPDFEEWTTTSFEEYQHRLSESVREAIEQQMTAGNLWFGQAFHEEGLDKVVEERPDLITDWICRADPFTREGARLIFKASSFYDGLCAVLLKKKQSLGIKLYNQLQQAPTRTRVIDRYTKIELLDFALFQSEPSDELQYVWNQKLDMCSTDEELMKIALVAQHGSGKDWLWESTKAGLGSRVPFEMGRSRLLLGFIEGEDRVSLIEQLIASDPDTWLRNCVKQVKERQERNDWAKHWFNRFLSASNDVNAWASIRLLLRCCDRRFWFWRERIESDVENAVDFRRKAYLRDNLDTIKRAIDRNEKQLTDQFLGQKILKRQAFPWF
jgi:hypothetical protein